MLEIAVTIVTIVAAIYSVIRFIDWRIERLCTEQPLTTQSPRTVCSRASHAGEWPVSGRCWKTGYANRYVCNGE
jgi:hypothetical protein